jgi:hypothetical protein
MVLDLLVKLQARIWRAKDLIRFFTLIGESCFGPATGFRIQPAFLYAGTSAAPAGRAPPRRPSAHSSASIQLVDSLGCYELYLMP